ncbi:MAG: hypothetical protein ACK5MA_09355 [Parachlamydiaceae bacterium]
MKTLGLSNFFDTYMLNPLSKDLTKKERAVAIIALALLIIPPLTFIPLTALALKKYEQRHELNNTTAKTQQASNTVLKKPPPPPPPRVRETFRKKVEMLQILAGRLAVSITAEDAERNVHRGMPNFKINLKNVCYFNSAVQSIEAVLMSQKNEFRDLLKQDLSLQEDETLQELEARLLHQWAPITSDSDRDIAFKWSFLLMMQAKQYGTDDQLYRAILAHRKIVFELRTEITENSNGRQLDAASYFEVFNEILQLSSVVRSRKRINLNAEEYPMANESLHVLQIPVKDRERVKLSDLIDRNFLPESLEEPFQPTGMNEVYTHEIVRLVGEAPQALFVQVKVFGTRMAYKEYVENVPEIEEQEGFGRVITHHDVRKRISEPVVEIFKIEPRIKVKRDQRIDLSKHYDLPKGSCVYELVAVCRHRGKVNAGHYIADVKPGKKWYTANDRSNRRHNGDLSSENGYIFSFKRVVTNP